MNQTVNYNQFILRKIHSLLGIIPLGMFLAVHFIVNTRVIYGEGAFAQAAHFMEILPGVRLMELFVIAIPLLFHGLMGLYIAYEARNNPKSYSYFRNWMFYLQRISGIILFAFILYHVWTVKYGDPNLSFYQILQAQMSNPFILVFYILSVTAAAFHLCNGLWGFAINWGIISGARAQAVFSKITIILFVIFNIFWFRITFAFI
ncbi:MAG: hypothetical protein JM58_08620 [Peptococcaceae bacterium BICA1-8]|nr:MAG: hypothetical protein JM58_08620 [Peptococcaceae bacterium BICA1-8]